MEIRLYKPYYCGNEQKYMNDAISRFNLSGDGHYSSLIRCFIEKNFHAKKALMTTSCSSALEMAAMLIDLKEGDEVILPSYTFTSTANAVLLRGARPVFADILQDTLNIDPAEIEKKVTDRTKAIITVHYAGVACNMDEIKKIADEKRLFIIEDAAQGVNAKYKDRYLGTIGDIGCYSFHESKNYSCGEGGAILINSDGEIFERAEIIREKGTNRSKFFRGEVDKYTWVDIGSSFLASDLLAACLYAQFEKLDYINFERKRVFEFYYNSLKELETQGLLRLPVIPDYCTPNYHIFYILLNSQEERDYLQYILKEKGIGAVFHYLPLHISPMGQKLGCKAGDLPVTENVSGRILRLPIYPGLGNNELEYIVESISNILKK